MILNSYSESQHIKLSSGFVFEVVSIFFEDMQACQKYAHLAPTMRLKLHWQLPELNLQLQFLRLPFAPRGLVRQGASAYVEDSKKGKSSALGIA